MSGLSQDQEEMRTSIQKTATIWGVVVGAIVGLLALWILDGQDSAIRFGGAALVALAVGVFVFRASFKSRSKSAQCEKCGAAFSRSRTNHVETVASSEAKEEREEQPDKSTKVTTWIEDKLDVVDTYTCAKCGDSSTKTYQTTRRRDEESTLVEPPKQAASSKKGAATAGKSAKTAPERTAGTPSPKASGGGKSGGSRKSGGAKSSKK